MFPNRFLALLQATNQRQRLRWLYSAILAGVPCEALAKIAVLGQRLTATASLSWKRSLDPNTVEGQTLLSVCCLILFLLLFFRLSAGDDRYMGQRYAHFRRRIMATPCAPSEKLSANHYLFDLLFLNGQAALLLYCVSQILEPDRFFLCFESILSINVCWLAWNFLRERNVTFTRLGTRILVTVNYLDCHRAGLRWALNNLLALVCFLLLRHLLNLNTLNHYQLLWASAGVCMLNSLLDLAATYWHYFPQASREELSEMPRG